MTPLTLGAKQNPAVETNVPIKASNESIKASNESDPKLLEIAIPLHKRLRLSGPAMSALEEDRFDIGLFDITGYAELPVAFCSEAVERLPNLSTEEVVAMFDNKMSSLAHEFCDGIVSLSKAALNVGYPPSEYPTLAYAYVQVFLSRLNRGDPA